MEENFGVIATFTLRRSGEFKFADIKNIAIMFLKTTLKDSIKVKITRN